VLSRNTSIEVRSRRRSGGETPFFSSLQGPWPCPGLAKPSYY